MKLALVPIAALVVFDLAVAFLTSLTLITPAVATGLLLANPLALILDRQLRARRAAGGEARTQKSLRPPSTCQ